jgi:3-phenylpropionate/trans-cinnamate dioxygenase ferredoxin reductase component
VLPGSCPVRGTAHVVIAGAGLGGLRAAEQLRAAGHGGPVTVIGAEPYPPYSRPPLSKELLAAAAGLRPEAAHEKVAFRRRKAIADVTFRLGQPVAAADLAAGKLSLADGEDMAFDGLVVATGLRPRRLLAPAAEPGAARVPLIPGSRVLRTLDDCLALRAALRPGTRLVIVGGGFIGCEVASTALALGCEVTVVEAGPAPMLGVLGEELAVAVQHYHEAAGARFITGQAVTGAAPLTGGGAAGLVLGDGTQVPAGVIVEATGSLANVEWLAGGGAGAGLDLSDGVLCDNTLAAVQAGPRAGGGGRVPVVAVGDVARFPNPLLDEVARRVEHWAMPGETARRAAVTLHALLTGSPAGAAPFTPVPEFWSDQLELRMQSYGTPGVADEARVTEGDPGRLTDGLVAVYRRGGRHVGTVAFNVAVARHRELREELLLAAQSPRG